MRTFAMAACFLMVAPIWGQLPPEGPERTKLLDQVLYKWETTMSQVKNLEADCERTTEDKVFRTKDVYKGTVKFLKGDGPKITIHASLNLVNAAKPRVSEQLILADELLYEVSPANQEIRVHDLSKLKVGESVEQIYDNLFGLLFGTKAAQAKAHYKIELVAEDNHYFYLRVGSKTPNDKANFEKAQLALIRTSHLPRRLELDQANGNRVTWDLQNIKAPANLRLADFEPPNLPGFKTIGAPGGK